MDWQAGAEKEAAAGKKGIAQELTGDIGADPTP